MSSPQPSSRSVSPQLEVPRHSVDAVTSTSADPFGHLSSFINSLQQKSKLDSDTISDLQSQISKLQQVQQTQQGEIDAIKGYQDALEKAKDNAGRESGEGDEGGVQAGVGRKRARSMTDTLEQENEVVDDADLYAAMIAKLATAESTILNEVRQNGTAAAGLEVECACGIVADEAADRLALKIDTLESTLKKVVEDKMAEIEAAIGDKLHAVESSIVGAVEDYSGGCDCGGVYDVGDVVERRIDELQTELSKDVGGASGKVDKLSEKVLAILDGIKSAQTQLLAKVNPSAQTLTAASIAPSHASRSVPTLPALPVVFPPVPPRRDLDDLFPPQTRVVPSRTAGQSSFSTTMKAPPSSSEKSSSFAKSAASSSQVAKEPARKRAKKHAVRFTQANDKLVDEDLARALFPGEDDSDDGDSIYQ